MLDHTDLKSMLKDPSLLRDQAFVAGEWVDADGGKSFPVTQPRARRRARHRARPRRGRGRPGDRRGL